MEFQFQVGLGPMTSVSAEQGDRDTEAQQTHQRKEIQTEKKAK